MAKRLDPATWAQIRLRYAAGASFGAMAKEFGVSKGTLGERAKAEGWKRGEVPNDPNEFPNDPNGRRSGGGKGKGAPGARAAAPPPPPIEEPESLEELNPRQRQFVREYGKDFNGTQAAIRAGYSPDSAAQQACDLLKHPKVSRAVAEAERLRAERTNITADRVRLELGRIALANIADFARWGEGGVELVESDELSDELTAGVLEVSETKDGPRIKLGKLPALRMLAEHTGLIGRRGEEDDGSGHEKALGDLE